MPPFYFLYPWFSKSLAVSDYFQSAKALSLAKRMMYLMTSTMPIAQSSLLPSPPLFFTLTIETPINRTFQPDMRV